jgi:uncharacterized protein (TIGR02271 family)
MTAPDIDTALEWQGRTVLDNSGERIGKLDEFFLDAETDLPAWGAVTSGLFGRRRSFVPLSDAEPAGDDELQVPFDKDHVLAAPQADPDVELSPDEEEALHRHYGLAYSTGDEAGDEGGALIRSEEEVDVRREARPRERVRLKKYVVTEHVTKTVPVRREKLAVEREPVGDEPAREEPVGDEPVGEERVSEEPVREERGDASAQQDPPDR